VRPVARLGRALGVVSREFEALFVTRKDLNGTSGTRLRARRGVARASPDPRARSKAEKTRARDRARSNSRESRRARR
jgi:hypothetical protein